MKQFAKYLPYVAIALIAFLLLRCYTRPECPTYDAREVSELRGTVDRLRVDSAIRHQVTLRLISEIAATKAAREPQETRIQHAQERSASLPLDTLVRDLGAAPPEPIY